MAGKRKIAVIFGTRPEAIKLAPVILELRRHPDRFDTRVCVTAQHREMLDQVLPVFGIVPDVDLDLMQRDQTLAGFTSRAIVALDEYMKEDRPDTVMVQGDTTTVFCSALVAFYNQVPVAHVEAGLRTWNMQAPWPEELNRVLASRLASVHFAPTASARENLLREGIPSGLIHVTGNTVIDALFYALEVVKERPVGIDGLTEDNLDLFKEQPMILITGHRRENFGEGFESICIAIRELANSFPCAHFVYPVHLNPNVQEPVKRILDNAPNRNIHLLKPLPYLPFIRLMSLSRVILTDSGGIQEEAPSLGKPVLVMREVTERPEAVDAGCVKLVGTSGEKITGGVSALLTDQVLYDSMSKAVNPYGDGRASSRIAQTLTQV